MTFRATILAARGEETAERETQRAVAAIFEFMRARREVPTVEHVHAFLDSEFGRFAAKDVLDKTPVARQLESRPARFLKHFAQVARKGAPK